MIQMDVAVISMEHDSFRHFSVQLNLHRHRKEMKSGTAEDMASESL